MSDAIAKLKVGTDSYYMDKMQEILYRSKGPDPGLIGSPSRIMDHVYMGNYRDAENEDYLHRLGITHVLNCAAHRESENNPYKASTGIVAYEQFHAEDREGYDIMQHFGRAKAFIDKCKRKDGKCLVHCAMGINRSGAICVAYLMYEKRMDLLTAMQYMRNHRGSVACNRSFQRQLVRFARMRGLLKPAKGDGY